jgi:hypothetical protein
MIEEKVRGKAARTTNLKFNIKPKQHLDEAYE